MQKEYSEPIYIRNVRDRYGDVGTGPVSFALSPDQARAHTTSLTEPLERAAQIQQEVVAAEIAIESVADLRYHALVAYDAATARMLAHRNVERSPEHQALVSKFAERELAALQRDIGAMEQLAVAGTARLLSRPHHDRR